MGAVAFAITLMLVLVAFKEPIEREVSKDSDDYRRGWFLNKPIRFYTLPNEVHGELDYTFFPTGVCNQSASYDSYEVSDISMCNVEIMNSDISNAYFHNAMIHECNIEDATIINSSIENCWIGQNVTIINCPPGSDPAAGIDLSRYFSNKLLIKYNLIKNNNIYYINNGKNICEQMKNLPSDKLLLNNSQKVYYLFNKMNDTISLLYPILNLSLMTNNYYLNYPNNNTVTIYGYYLNNTFNITYLLNLEIYCDINTDISYFNYSGYAHLKNYYNYSQDWNNSVNEIFRNKYQILPQYNAQLTINNLIIEGDNSTVNNILNFLINYTIDNRFFELDFIEKKLMNIDYSYNKELLNIPLSNDYLSILDIHQIFYKTTNDYSTLISKGITNNNMKLTENSQYTILNDKTCSEYQWTEANNEETRTYTIDNNGKIIDPKFGPLSRVFITAFGKKIGIKLEMWYKLTKDDCQKIQDFVSWGTLTAALIGLIMSKFGPVGIGLSVALAVVAWFLATYWYTIKILLIDPDNDDDLDLHLKITGLYSIGGKTTIYAYKYDKGDEYVPLIIPIIGSNELLQSGKDIRWYRDNVK